MFDLSIAHDRFGSSSHVQQNGCLSHPQDLEVPLRIAAQRKIDAYQQQYADNQNISFLLLLLVPPPACMASFCVFFFYRPTGRQRRCILQRPEEQSRTGSCQDRSIAGQPQCPRLCHSSTPNARFLSHSPSAPPPPFTQSPYPPRSLVRDEQTHSHRPRLVVSHSTCPPLSSSPHAAIKETS